MYFFKYLKFGAHTLTPSHPYRDIVEYLLSNGASLLVHDVVSKRTPLHAAAFNGHTDTVQAMLKHLTSTAHIDCVDMMGRTPLMMAVSNGHKDTTQLLVDHGAHVDCTDKHLRTALHRAVSGWGYWVLTIFVSCEKCV